MNTKAKKSKHGYLDLQKNQGDFEWELKWNSKSNQDNLESSHVRTEQNDSWEKPNFTQGSFWLTQNLVKLCFEASEVFLLIACSSIYVLF